MNRIDGILNHDLFMRNLKMITTAEADRRFCRHGLEHFLDVARIGMILNLEEKLGIEKELVYAAALLHDIGKHLQYSENIPHERASAEIAPQILADCGFDVNETDVIVDAILNHRNQDAAQQRNLKGLLYRADKASRPCFFCQAAADCNWEERRKNCGLTW